MDDDGEINRRIVIPTAEFDRIMAWLDEEDPEPAPGLLAMVKRVRERQERG